MSHSFWSKPQIKYGLAGLLCLLYLVVAFLALNPNASAEHQAYYIDRTSNCHHNQPAASIAPSTSIRFGAKRPHQTCTTLIEGWDWQQTWGTWSTGTSATLRFQIQSDAHQHAQLLFHVLGFAPLGQQKAWVFVNGAYMDEWHLPHENQTTFELQIPLTRADEQIEIEFYFSNPHELAWFDKATNPIDQRSVAMGLLGFQWIEPHMANE